MPYTRFKGAEWLGHIVENAERIRDHLGGSYSSERFDTPLVADAVERCLERISEAAARLHRAGEDLDQHAPEVAWADVRGFGNIVRHEYDGVDPNIVRNTVVRDLPVLVEAATRLQRLFNDDAAPPPQRPMA